MQEGLGDSLKNPLQRSKGSGIVGETRFIEWVKETVVQGKGDAREQPSCKKMRVSLDAQVMVERFCAVTGKRREDICRRGVRTVARAQLMELLYQYCDITQPEIGKIAGGVDYSAVSQARKRLRKKLEADAQLKEQYRAIERNIVKLSK